jgi:hypothetical protein
MGLGDDLTRIAAQAAAHGDVSAVLAAEPARGERLYLVAFGGEDDRRWLVLDDAGAVVDRRDDVRDAASIVAMVEVVADVAGAPDEPRLATPAYLDETAATLPEIVGAVRSSTGIVDAFVKDVVRGYLVELR